MRRKDYAADAKERGWAQSESVNTAPQALSRSSNSKFESKCRIVPATHGSGLYSSAVVCIAHLMSIFLWTSSMFMLAVIFVLWTRGSE